MNFSTRISIFLVCIAITASSAGSTIKLGLFYDQNIETLVFSTIEGEYIIYGDGRQTAVVKKDNMFYLELSGSKIEIHDTAGNYGSFSKIEFRGISANNIFQVKPVFPSIPPKESEDDLSVDFYNESLRIINTIDLEKYIPGTVEAEGGSVALPEYYKAQAIISRTFAMKNFARHAHEGFNICDGVHCQAFNGKSRMNREIYAASIITNGLVLADNNNKPAVTAYHSCCGGITGSASTEWNRELYYLVPVNDPFCNQSRQRSWSVKITAAKWNDYLTRQGIMAESKLIYSGESGRRKYLLSETRELPLTEIRKEFNLKSSYFNVVKSGESVIFEGHGYGHGLGLCQQGAMEMAKAGYTYVDILMFYFRGLKLIRL